MSEDIALHMLFLDLRVQQWHERLPHNVGVSGKLNIHNDMGEYSSLALCRVQLYYEALYTLTYKQCPSDRDLSSCACAKDGNSGLVVSGLKLA